MSTCWTTHLLIISCILAGHTSDAGHGTGFIANMPAPAPAPIYNPPPPLIEFGPPVQVFRMKPAAAAPPMPLGSSRKVAPGNKAAVDALGEEKKLHTGHGPGEFQPVSYIAQVVVENLCSERTIMPGFRFTDKRVHELADYPIANLPPNHYQVFNVPYDVHEVQVWPRVNCRDDGTECESGGCVGEGSDRIHCRGSALEIEPLTTVHLDLRDGDNVYDGVDKYSVVPWARSENMHVQVIPSNGKCPTLDTAGSFEHAQCDNSATLSQQTYTIKFCPP